MIVILQSVMCVLWHWPGCVAGSLCLGGRLVFWHSIVSCLAHCGGTEGAIAVLLVNNVQKAKCTWHMSVRHYPTGSATVLT